MGNKAKPKAKPPLPQKSGINWSAWIIGIAGVLATIAAIAWPSVDPDIIFASPQDPTAGFKIIEVRAEPGPTGFVDPAAKVKWLVSFHLAFTNRSFKSGSIREADLTLLRGLGDFVDARITAFDKVPIAWRETRVVNFRGEVRALGHFTQDSLKPHGGINDGPLLNIAAHYADVDLELRCTDNSGHSIVGTAIRGLKGERFTMHFSPSLAMPQK